MAARSASGISRTVMFSCSPSARLRPIGGGVAREVEMDALGRDARVGPRDPDRLEFAQAQAHLLFDVTTGVLLRRPVLDEAGGRLRMRLVARDVEGGHPEFEHKQGDAAFGIVG